MNPPSPQTHPNEVFALLETHKNERGIQHWNRRYATSQGALKSYGIGLTVLRKLAKSIGRNHELALQLWDSNFYDAKVIALLIDDPKKISRKQVEEQVEEVKQGHLAHVFSTCNATLSKTPFALDLAVDWMKSDNIIRKSCGYGLLYEFSKSKKKNAPDNNFFLNWLKQIEINFDQEHISVQSAMGCAVLGIGKRNVSLHKTALEIAKQLGPIQFESSGDSCAPLDLIKHLTSDYLRSKLKLEPSV
jgi:3-methyladenine DNA glycosylase AlkD